MKKIFIFSFVFVGLNSWSQSNYSDYFDEGLKLYKQSGLAYGNIVESHEAVFSDKEVALAIVEKVDRIKIGHSMSEDQINAEKLKSIRLKRLRGWLGFENLYAQINLPIPLGYILKAGGIQKNNDVLLRIKAVSGDSEVMLKESGINELENSMEMWILSAYEKELSAGRVNSGRKKYLAFIESLMKEKSAGDFIHVEFKAEVYHQKTNEVLLNLATERVMQRIPANPYYFKDNYFYSNSVISKFWNKQIDKEHVLYKKLQENLVNDHWKRGYLPDFSSLVGAIHLSHDNNFCDYYRSDYDGIGIVYKNVDNKLIYIELHPAYEGEDNGYMNYYYDYASSERKWQFHDDVVFWCQEDPNDENSEWYYEVMQNNSVQELHPDIFIEKDMPDGVKPSARQRAEERQKAMKERYYNKNK